MYPDKTEVAADITIKNLTLDGLNTFDSFKVLHPVSAHKALSKISVGNISHPISSSILIELNTVNKYQNNRCRKNRLKLSIGFSNISVQAITNIFLDIDRILESSIGALRSFMHFRSVLRTEYVRTRFIATRLVC